MHNNSYQKIPVILSIIFAVIFGLCFSYRGWQLCCVSFSNWSLLNPISFISFCESLLFSFILFFIIVNSRFHAAIKLFYASYILTVILIDSPYRFYLTTLTALFALGHLTYVFLVEKKQKFDVLVFVFLALITFAFFPWISPFQFDEKFISDFRMINANLIVIQPIYKGFLAAKFLNFSSIDFADYAAAISVPVGDKSFVVQILAYVFDLPSISTKVFLFLLDFLGLALLTIGSFLTYILFKNYLKASSIVSIAAAMLLFPLNIILSSLYTNDNWLMITCYSVIPLALIAGIRVINNEKNSILIGAFVLSLPFVLISVHPNYYIILLIIFFALTTFLSAEQSNDFPEFSNKMIKVAAVAAVSLLFSAHYLLPIIKQSLSWDCHVISHNSARCFRHCNKEIIITLIAFLFTAYLSFKKRKIVIGLYFTAALLLVCYLMKKTYLMDFVFVSIAGGINDRYIMLLWFISCFIVLYYFRNLNHKSLYYALPALAIAALSYSTYKYSPSFTALFKPKESYHIFLKAELANYPALKGDKSNAYYIKDKISEYEKDFNWDVSYKSYEEKLEKFGVKNIKEVNSPEKIIEIADAVVDVIDSAYAKKVRNFDEKKFLPAISTYNTSVIYYGLKPFHRIESSTGHDFHMGAGPGLLLNNNSTSFDPRYMVGYITAEFLYVTKDYDDIYYKGEGAPYDKLPWVNFDPQHKKTQHMMNLAGVDYITANREITGNLKKLKTFQLFGSTYNLYQNPSSYGVSYIANVKAVTPQEDIKAMKDAVKDYLKNRITYKSYKNKMIGFEAPTLQLKNKYDALVTENEDLKNNSGSGKSAIESMIGNNIITKATCQNKDCILALNFAHFPQWKAFSPSFSQYKINDVNFAFMGVRVSPGEHKVMFVYLSYFNEAFAIISLLMVLLMVVRNKFYFRKI